MILFNRRLLVLASAVSLASCSWVSSDDELAFNHVQMIGSHNSYKKPLNPEVRALMAEKNADAVAKIDYSHLTLDVQLHMGMRHFEIDIVKDPSGARFAQPLGEALTGQQILSDEERVLLTKPGFKVMHIPDLDFSSHCVLFQACIDELNTFSDKNPQHLPIVILMNLKGTANRFIQGTEVLAFDSDDYAELDQILLNTFGKKLITPDEVRGEHVTLEQGVLNQGWPSLSQARGRFLFVFDGKRHQLQEYRQNHPSLKGRALFASYLAGEPEAALMVRNNPIRDLDEITALVNKGYMVRTRADSGDGTLSQTAKVKLQTEYAIKSGAQIISTDFYPGAPQVLSADFAVSFKGGELNQCHPLLTSATCSLAK